MTLESIFEEQYSKHFIAGQKCIVIIYLQFMLSDNHNHPTTSLDYITTN